MKDRDIPITSAVRTLRNAGIPIIPLFYNYIEHGGTKHASESLGLEEHAVVKTLIMEVHDTRKKFVIILMHGDREVSIRELGRVLGVKRVLPASATDVEKCTGFIPGGVSPFGTRSLLPVYAEESIFRLERIFINGGKRGFLVEIKPDELTKVLKAIPVQVAIEKRI
jgi:Cys-tRNA(Pro) deacylase